MLDGYRRSGVLLVVEYPTSIVGCNDLAKVQFFLILIIGFPSFFRCTLCVFVRYGYIWFVLGLADVLLTIQVLTAYLLLRI